MISANGCSLTVQVKEHTPLVQRLANQLIVRMSANVERDDLIQEGLIGLSDAIKRFDEGYGVRFETFATTRIRGAMLERLRKDDWMSRDDRRQSKSIEKAIRVLSQQLTRTPDEREIAKLMGMTLSKFQELRDHTRTDRHVYLEDLVNLHDLDHEGENIFLSDQGRGDPSKIFEDKSRLEQLVEAIGKLPERLRYVMEMRYEQDMSLLHIADQLKVTESRACQLHTKALEKIRVMLATPTGPVRRGRASRAKH